MTPAEAGQILRCTIDSPPALVRAAWRVRVRETHPDGMGGGDVDEFMAVTAAFDVLMHAAVNASVAPSRSDDILFEPPSRQQSSPPVADVPEPVPFVATGRSRADDFLFASASADRASGATVTEPPRRSEREPGVVDRAVVDSPPPDRRSVPDADRETPPVLWRLLIGVFVALCVAGARVYLVSLEVSPIAIPIHAWQQAAGFGLIAGLAAAFHRWRVVVVVAGATLFEAVPYAVPGFLVLIVIAGMRGHSKGV